jgi:hypothetical protein
MTVLTKSFLAIPNLLGILRGKKWSRAIWATTHPTMVFANEYGTPETHARVNLVRGCVGLIGNNPPSKRICFRGAGVMGPMTLKTLLCSSNDALPQHRSVLRAINPINPHKKHIHLLGGLSPINPTCQRRTQGLLWGSKGPFPPAAAMVMRLLLPLDLWGGSRQPLLL